MGTWFSLCTVDLGLVKTVSAPQRQRILFITTVFSVDGLFDVCQILRQRGFRNVLLSFNISSEKSSHLKVHKH